MEEFITFCKQFPVKHFEKGELILVQGEVPHSVFVVKSGVVKSYNITTQGEEKPIEFNIKDEIFPVAWTFHKARYAQYYYEAFTDCDVYSVPREEYRSFLKNYPESSYPMMNYFVSALINSQMRINALEQSKATTKVINTIHFLCLRFGVTVKPGTVEIKLPLTQQDLANFMGLTRETTGIELKKLQRKGILTYRKQNYSVKIEKLDELLDEDYDQGRTAQELSGIIGNLNKVTES